MSAQKNMESVGGKELFRELLGGPVRVPLAQFVESVLEKKESRQFSSFREEYSQQLFESDYCYDTSHFPVVEAYCAMDFLKERDYYRVTSQGLEALLNSTRSTVKPVVEEMKKKKSESPLLKRPLVRQEKIKLTTNNRKIDSFHLTRNAQHSLGGLKQRKEFRYLTSVFERIFPEIEKFTLEQRKIESRLKKKNVFHIPSQKARTRNYNIPDTINVEVFRKELAEAGRIPMPIGRIWKSNSDFYVFSPLGRHSGETIAELYATKDKLVAKKDERLMELPAPDFEPKRYVGNPHLNYSLKFAKELTEKLRDKINRGENPLDEILGEEEYFPFYPNSMSNVSGVEKGDAKYHFKKEDKGDIWIMSRGYSLIKKNGFVMADKIPKKTKAF